MSRIVLIGDLHLGNGCYNNATTPESLLVGNVVPYDEMVVEFMKWVIQISKEQEADAVFQLGDWFDRSDSIDVRTLNYSIECSEILSDYFGIDNTFAILGNHDIFIQNRSLTREINSLKVLNNKLTVVDECIWVVDGMLLVPWMCNNQHYVDFDIGVRKNKPDYIFGHFSLKSADILNIKNTANSIDKFPKIYSGHLHLPKETDTITYIGSPLSINYNEFDTPRGIHILDTSKKTCEFFMYDYKIYLR
jgi:DNA repair exonuclease SbcCD nuclease subunit